MKKEKIKTTITFYLPYHDGNNWQVITIPENTETYIYICSPIGYSTKTEIDILYMVSIERIQRLSATAKRTTNRTNITAASY